MEVVFVKGRGRADEVVARAACRIMCYAIYVHARGK